MDIIDDEGADKEVEVDEVDDGEESQGDEKSSRLEEMIGCATVQGPLGGWEKASIQGE